MAKPFGHDVLLLQFLSVFFCILFSKIDSDQSWSQSHLRIIRAGFLCLRPPPADSDVFVLSVHARRHASVCASCLCSISGVHWEIFTKLFSVEHLGTNMNSLGFGVRRPKVKVGSQPGASIPQQPRRYSPNFPLFRPFLISLFPLPSPVSPLP